MDKLPSNSVDQVIAILIDWVNSAQFESFYSILVHFARLKSIEFSKFWTSWFNLVNFWDISLEFRLSYLISINWVLAILLDLGDFALFRSSGLL